MSQIKPPAGFGSEINKYLNHYVTVADAKAAGILTADLALGGYLMTGIPTTTWPIGFHWIAVISLLASGILALFTLYPRTPRIGSSLIFWEDIRTRTTVEQYLEDLRQVDDDEVERQYGAQNYIVSELLSRKYQCVRWGLRALMVAILFVLLRLMGG